MLQRHLTLLSLVLRVQRQAERLQTVRQRLLGWWDRTRMRRQERLRVLAGKLDALSPLAILARGYAICFALPERRVLKAAAEAAAGSRVAVRLHDGELTCLVQAAQGER
jgi:exodeoxyribonuclease VII large subunit